MKSLGLYLDSYLGLAPEITAFFVSHVIFKYMNLSISYYLKRVNKVLVRILILSRLDYVSSLCQLA